MWLHVRVFMQMDRWMDEVQFRLIFYRKIYGRWSITRNIIHTFFILPLALALSFSPSFSVSFASFCSGFGFHHRCCFSTKQQSCLHMFKCAHFVHSFGSVRSVEISSFCWWKLRSSAFPSLYFCASDNGRMVAYVRLNVRQNMQILHILSYWKANISLGNTVFQK